MGIFVPKLRVSPFRKMNIFQHFELLLFIAQKGVFFVLEYSKRYFPGRHCLKKKVEKLSFLDQNHRLTSLKKCHFFDFLNILFLQPRQASFSFYNIVKDIFLAYITYKKVGKMGIFGPKPWVNPFGKISIFRHFELLVFFSLERRFFVLTPLEKCQFLDFLTFLFLEPRKTVFPAKIS